MSGRPDHAQRRVLLVEDELLVAWVLQDMLIALGCTVVGPAARLSQAMTMIANEPIDAAVLDVNLNGELSYPIADLLIARGVPFAFSTGYDRARLPEAYRACRYLQKPFVQSDLARTIDALLPPTAPAAAGGAARRRRDGAWRTPSPQNLDL